MCEEYQVKFTAEALRLVYQQTYRDMVLDYRQYTFMLAAAGDKEVAEFLDRQEIRFNILVNIKDALGQAFDEEPVMQQQYQEAESIMLFARGL